EEKGIDEFKNKIKDMFINGLVNYNDEVIITNERHVRLIDDSINSINEIINGINIGISEDFISIDMVNAYKNLGLIIGESIEDDIVDEIFSKFCMGK
nr:tRNA uridine-5-carboxymethylaminomethyl(34) synthesis GTPase MnmE [Lachnospiraceae bacterium]